MLDFTFHITTPRLHISYLNPSNDAHADFLLDMYNAQLQNDPQNAHKALPDRAAAHKVIQEVADRLEKTGWGRYLISLKPPPLKPLAPGEPETEIPFSEAVASTLPVGIVTMQMARHPGAPTLPDVGYGLHPMHLGNGYATEAAVGLCRYYDEVKGFKAFAGYCDPLNVGSSNVLGRAGFSDRGMRQISGVVENVVLTDSVWTRGVGGEESDLKAYGL